MRGVEQAERLRLDNGAVRVLFVCVRALDRHGGTECFALIPQVQIIVKDSLVN